MSANILSRSWHLTGSQSTSEYEQWKKLARNIETGIPMRKINPTEQSMNRRNRLMDAAKFARGIVDFIVDERWSDQG